uniref:Phytanoyl-CoA dioxygenase domain containing 1 n=1 Tax=Homo sapiens TaxID=9606 RepID=F8WCG7_HUMAN
MACLSPSQLQKQPILIALCWVPDSMPGVGDRAANKIPGPTFTQLQG